ncbi:hypothetical protein ATANTOWER_002877 [Ataeniobius toweri]|uniref:Uncharacterized protein n=1 Tax=Ataeniobius toweri TaxID=208326 RepID=A0ABU7ADN4_9TELE|nr:hypothetical protein [Ataeniobius toweri]
MSAAPAAGSPRQLSADRAVEATEVTLRQGKQTDITRAALYANLARLANSYSPADDSASQGPFSSRETRHGDRNHTCDLSKVNQASHPLSAENRQGNTYPVRT